MTEKPLIKGWCPGALRPMLAGDGLIVRIRPPAGRLSSAQARGIAAIASRYGNGVINISNRANLQVRGVRTEHHDALLGVLGEFDLLDHNARSEARRNIIVTPFWQEQTDPARLLADDLARALAGSDAPALPEKFGFAIDTGRTPVLQSAPADIRLERIGNGSLICTADGAVTGAPVTLETAVDVVLDLSRWFLQTGGARDGRGRMAAHIARGVPLPAQFTAAARVAASYELPLPGMVAQGYLVGLAFGQMQADTLAELARYGDLRLTPWRMVLIEGLRERPEIDHLLLDPEDPLTRVVACTGAPGCPQAHQATRPLARALATHVPEGSVLHVSGCAKGCAHPGTAPRTLVAGPDGFSLILHGRAGDAPSAGPLSADALANRPSPLNKVH